jgi:diacylglycerol kinase (ATP)
MKEGIKIKEKVEVEKALEFGANRFKPKRFSLAQRVKSFSYAIKGILALLKTEHNARVHLVAAVLVVGLGIVLNVALWEWTMLVLAIGLVFMCEIFNSAIEYLADFVSPGYNELIGKAKDLAAGGVLIGSITALLIGCLIFLPKLYYLLLEVIH